MRQFSDLLRYTLIHSLALLIAIIWIAIVRNTMEILLYWNLILTRWNVHVHFSFETFSRLDGHLERERNLKPNNIITYVVQSRAVNGWLIHDAYINWPICRVNAVQCMTSLRIQPIRELGYSRWRGNDLAIRTRDLRFQPSLLVTLEMRTRLYRSAIVHLNRV